MAYNEKQRAYNDKYDAQNMVAYTVKYQKSIYEMVEKAMTDTGMNRNRWTTTAIVEKLERDGYIQSKDNSDQAANTDDDKLPWEE
mgnify:CR=1 FL=1